MAARKGKSVARPQAPRNCVEAQAAADLVKAEFPVGSVVMLKSGGLRMTVLEDIPGSTSNTDLVVGWAHPGGGIETMEVDALCLMIAPPPDVDDHIPF